MQKTNGNVCNNDEKNEGEKMRKSGILLPIFSLASDYGIGAFSKEAFEFVDMLRKTGQSYWQILPLGPTGYGDSPYQSFSTFAGNPYFIDLAKLIEKEWITEKDCESALWKENETAVNYDILYMSRWAVLRKAFDNSNIAEDEDFQAFCKENEEWLDDYALYTVIKKLCENKGWNEWEDDYRLRKKRALKKIEKEHAEDLLFQKFLQYEFTVQWLAVKKYANENGIQIIGDIPIYVSFDSADAWANPNLFQFDKDGKPKAVAGCPPDAFSETGQLWGNPLYNWKHHKKTDYEWWLKRIAYCNKLYDVIRIDHFRGFDEYWAIPYGDKTAENGKWEKGPGMDLFEAIQKELPEVKIIAEDLGFLTPTVLQMLADSGYPGMKVLQFAFDGDLDNAYLPYNHIKKSVIYTGTHDNETTVGWYRNLKGKKRTQVLELLSRGNEHEGEITWELIRMAHVSASDTCIIPMQDYLCLGNEARINEPSTLGGNWKWRMQKDQISAELMKAIYRMTRIHGRLSEIEKEALKKRAAEATKEVAEEEAATEE